MLDVDTFLTSLYVTVDDFYQSRPRKEQRPGPDASLSPSEIATLTIFARWSRFSSERDFYRYASSRLRDAFPALPNRAQFNRCAPQPGSHRGGSFASGERDEGPRMPLRSSGQLGDDSPGCQASGRRMAGWFG